MASPKHKCLFTNDVFASCRSPDCSLYQWIGVCCCVVVCRTWWSFSSSSTLVIYLFL